LWGGMCLLQPPSCPSACRRFRSCLPACLAPPPALVAALWPDAPPPPQAGVHIQGVRPQAAGGAAERRRGVWRGRRHGGAPRSGAGSPGRDCRGSAPRRGQPCHAGSVPRRAPGVHRPGSRRRGQQQQHCRRLTGGPCDGQPGGRRRGGVCGSPGRLLGSSALHRCAPLRDAVCVSF
jgi:hypothetical protein